MHFPLTALLWERWRRTHWALATATFAPAVGWLVRVAGYDTVGNIVAQGAWFLGLQLLAVVLLFSQCEARNLNLGFPKRLFRFPMSTVALLAVYMGYGVVAMALPILVAFAVAKAFGDTVENGWTIFLIIETGFIWLQTLAWFNGVRAVFFFLIPSLAGAITFLYLAAKYVLPLDANIVCLVIIVLCCGISFWCVSAERRGAWISGWRWVDLLFSLFRRRRTKSFASALQAQMWFESRQTGYLFPVTVLGFVGPVLIVRIVLLILSNDYPPPALAPFESIPETLFPFVLAAWVGGSLCFAVHHRDRQSGASSFWLRRPIATWTIAYARLRAMARSLAGTLATVAVITLALLARDWIVGAQSGIAGFIPQSLEDRSALEVGLCAVLAVFGFALVCWAFLELPGEIFLVGMGLELAWVVVWLCFGGDIVRTVEFLVSDTVRWSACIVVAALILGTLWILSVVRRRELIDSGALVSMALVFPVVVVSLGVSLIWTGTIWDWPTLMEGIYILGAAAVPFIPLATVSLAIAKQRHR